MIRRTEPPAPTGSDGADAFRRVPHRNAFPPGPFPDPPPRGLGAIFEGLRPYDGRLEMTFHIALLCGLTAVITMMLRVPEAFLSCYLIFLMYRDNAGDGIFIGVGLIIAAAAVVAFTVFLLTLVADWPLFRLAMMGAITFAGMWLSRATKLGEPAGLLTLIIVFILSVVDYVSIPEIMTRGLIWAWIMTFVPMALLITLNIVIGRSPLDLIRGKLQDRLTMAVTLVEGGSTTDGQRLLAEGNERLFDLANKARMLGELSKDELPPLEAQIEASFDLLAAAQASAIAGEAGPRVGSALQALLRGAPADLPDSGAPLTRAARAMEAAREVSISRRRLPKKPAPFLLPDAFTNPDYSHFGLKVVLAVFLTYTFYTSIGFFEIHTAMITCFIVALGSSGETFQKSSLRIAGCLIGAAMGAFAVIAVMPQLTDVGQLFLLVAAGSFIAAWVAMGPYQVQYAGLQMALAFFICVLPGTPLNYGPNYDLSDAGYRILGILTGISIMWLIFANVWPESAARSQAEETNKAFRAMADYFRGRDELAAVHQALAAARHDSNMATFERLGAPADRKQDALEARLSAAEEVAQLLPLLKGERDVELLTAALAKAGGDPEQSDTSKTSKSQRLMDPATNFVWSRLEMLSQERRGSGS